MESEFNRISDDEFERDMRKLKFKRGLIYVMGGILLAIASIIWFVVGFLSGVIFFYPPVLLVIGIGMSIKGALFIFNKKTEAEMNL